MDMVLDTLDIKLASVAPMPSQRPMLMLIMDTMVMDTDMLVMDTVMVMDTMVGASKSRSNITRKQ